MKTITLKEYIELLEFKLMALEYAKEEDNSWNYGIGELKNEIKELKSLVD